MPKVMGGWRRGCWAVATCFVLQPALAQSKPEFSIEGLLKGGWTVAGYAGTFDNRSTVILFRHASETFLVQCATIHDVTRTPRIITNCYALR